MKRNYASESQKRKKRKEEEDKKKQESGKVINYTMINKTALLVLYKWCNFAAGRLAKICLC